jgi:hypothetical protein
MNTFHYKTKFTFNLNIWRMLSTLSGIVVVVVVVVVVVII